MTRDDTITHAQTVCMIAVADAGRRGIRLAHQIATPLLRRQWIEVVAVPNVDRRRAKMVTRGAVFYRLTAKGDLFVKRVKRFERDR